MKENQITLHEIKSFISLKNLVKWNGKLFNIISVDLGGKCKIKQMTTTRRIGKTWSNIDMFELQKVD